MAFVFSRHHFRNVSPFLIRLPCSFSSSHTGPGTKTPPRKGRQAVRRLLKLLNPDASTAPRAPSLACAVTALAESPESVSSAVTAALVSAAANPLLAFDFYRFLKTSAPFRPEPDIYVALLRCQLLSISPAVFRIRYYLKEMRKRGLRIPMVDLHELIHPLLPEKADLVRRFVEEVEGVFGIDSGLCAQLMTLYAENRLVEDAIAVAEKAKAAPGGMDRMDPDFYCRLLGLYSTSGDAKSAMEMFAEMRNRGFSASKAAYTDLLRVLHRVRWLRLCSVVLEEMVRRHDGLTLDEPLGVDLMRAFVEQGMIAQAEFLFKEGVVKEKESLMEFGRLMEEKKDCRFGRLILPRT